MANRIADIRELSGDQLMLLQKDDIEFTGLPAAFKLDAGDQESIKFLVVCPKCSHASKSARLVPGQEGSVPEMPCRFYGGLGRAGGELMC